MLVLTVAFLPVLLIPEIDRHLGHATRSAFEVAD